MVDRDGLTPIEAHTLAKAAMAVHRAKPPDLDEWARTISGLARLCAHAREQTMDGRHETAAFVRLVATIAETAAQLRTDATIAYVCSGAAAGEFAARARDELLRMRDEVGEGDAHG